MSALPVTSDYANIQKADFPVATFQKIVRVRKGQRAVNCIVLRFDVRRNTTFCVATYLQMPAATKSAPHCRPAV